MCGCHVWWSGSRLMRLHHPPPTLINNNRTVTRVCCQFRQSTPQSHLTHLSLINMSRRLNVLSHLTLVLNLTILIYWVVVAVAALPIVLQRKVPEPPHGIGSRETTTTTPTYNKATISVLVLTYGPMKTYASCNSS